MAGSLFVCLYFVPAHSLKLLIICIYIMLCEISALQISKVKLLHRFAMQRGFIFPEWRRFHSSSLFLISLECAAQSSNCMHAPLRASKYKCSSIFIPFITSRFCPCLFNLHSAWLWGQRYCGCMATHAHSSQQCMQTLIRQLLGGGGSRKNHFVENKLTACLIALNCIKFHVIMFLFNTLMKGRYFSNCIPCEYHN
jgi:hypothetical protein